MADSNVENTMSTRDRVRAMVREVLASVPSEAEPEKSFEPEHVVVNSLKEQREREYDRDESSKTLITEDDLRGLDEGARVRVSANAKFTPLAADIVSDKKIELIRKQSRDAGLVIKSVAIGADHGGYPLNTDAGSRRRTLTIESSDANEHIAMVTMSVAM